MRNSGFENDVIVSGSRLSTSLTTDNPSIEQLLIKNNNKVCSSLTVSFHCNYHLLVLERITRGCCITAEIY